MGAAQSDAAVREEGTREPFLERVTRTIELHAPGARGGLISAFFRLLHARTPLVYFRGLSPETVAGRAAELFEFFEQPAAGFRVRIRPAGAPGLEAGRGQRAALETVGPDQPFILDSLLELLRVRGRVAREAFHPVFSVDRGPSGTVVSVSAPRQGAELVSVVRIEVDGPLSAEESAALEGEASRVLEEARRAVADFEPILARLGEVEASYGAAQQGSGDRERAEFREILDFASWLRASNFVFLGYGRADSPGPMAGLRLDPATGLGVLRAPGGAAGAEAALLEEDLRRVLSAPDAIAVHKSSIESRVVRRTRLDLVAIRDPSAPGRPSCHAFLGLLTAKAYNDLPSDIPILRRKLSLILEETGIVPGSHDHREIFSIFTSIPKAELFAMDTRQLAESILTVISEARRSGIRVIYRPDVIARGVSVMVLMPREKFNVAVREAIQALLSAEFRGTVVDYRLALSDEPMARLHFYLISRETVPPSPPHGPLEARISDITRTWPERLRAALSGEGADDEAAELADRYERAFPTAYVAQKSPAAGAEHARQAETTIRHGSATVTLSEDGAGEGARATVLEIFNPGEAVSLSRLMPVLTDLGLRVLDEQTFRISPLPRTPSEAKAEGATPAPSVVFLHSLRLLGPDGRPLPEGNVVRNVADIVPRILSGRGESDSLNSLVVTAGLDRRQVSVLRAYEAYLYQLGGRWRQRTTSRALCGNPGPSAALVALFEARFDPSIGDADRPAREETALESFRASLQNVSGIHEDQIFRVFENLIRATVRTSFFRRDSSGLPPAVLSLKVRCADVDVMPEPRPLYEIFVHGTDVEGVHLRSGKVARGGIRWSSRVDDYRTEVLGLMRAQRAKNAVIVPVGAKGGFLLRRASPVSPPPAEVRTQYAAFIGALLDVTDNLVEGRVVHPADVVVRDEDDPYLVVAADRGTATFSDLANEIAASRGFWLGDAFASGGSLGFDHKKEAITARGAWECVKRHFRELGIDIGRDRFTVAGIGDMSGDVFGNGLLQSRNILLRAAFNHAHVFLDPAPDAEVSWAERRRLFELPRSAWTDYDPAKISAGGGVFRRDSKEIRLSPEASSMLELDRSTVNGEELVRAVLRMRVDLLWNGGIGTYVKARSETHAEVSDPTNDAVRVDAADLRARVVGEGGNLGFTQRGRVEYARAGGRINTDFIDNSAGVDLSDHEVNLKILLSAAARRAGLPEAERVSVLRSSVVAVCEQVLAHNRSQALVLSLEERRGASAMEDWRLLIDELAARKLLHREVEKIPSDQEIVRLRESRQLLTRPELAVLLAYAKIDACDRISRTSLPDRPELERFAREYFPPAVASRFRDSVGGHRLRREIATTAAVNEAINTLGIAFFHRVARISGSEPDAILRAYLVAASLARAGEVRGVLEALSAAGAAPVEPCYRGLLRLAEAVEDTVLAILRRRLDEPAASTVERYGALLAAVDGARGRAAAHGSVSRSRQLEDLPREAAGGIAAALDLPDRLELADLAAQVGAEGDAEILLAEQAWDQAGASLLHEPILEESGRIPKVTADDLQACAALLERLRASRRKLARAILGKLRSLGAGAEAGTFCRVAVSCSPADPDLSRLRAMLERARTREPLTPSGLFVMVEAVDRLADRLSDA